jgi:hypothetical protein
MKQPTIQIQLTNRGIEIVMTDGNTYAFTTDGACRLTAGLMRAVDMGLNGMLEQRLKDWGFQETIQLMNVVQSKGLTTTDLGMVKQESVKAS